jgi:hypothetical protein
VLSELFSALGDLPVEPLSAQSRPTHLSHSPLPFTLILDDTLTLAAATLATTQLAKVLQQDSRLLLNESDNKYPPTPSSLTKLDGNSATRGDKADSERMGRMAPARGVSRERFFYWCLDLFF